MTALTDHLLRRIAANGPLTVAEYMADGLLHPTHGYYTTRTPLGRAGDFITAPEISQMFGELVGLCLAQAWMDRGCPAPFALAELGPGRGTLMADALRATRGVDGFHAALQLHLVEASSLMRNLQVEALTGYAPHFHQSTATLPDLPLFLIANEFFDALPIRQFRRTIEGAGDGWREVVVGITEEALAFGLSDPMAVPALTHRLNDTEEGDFVEYCPAAQPILQDIAARIAAQDGVALIIDYGDWRSLGDTLQALRAHEPEHPLANPGAADLTAHVDFEALALWSAPARHTRLTPQGTFLERLGIGPRAEQLARGLTGDALQSHLAAYQRLTDPTQMGDLFKVMGLFKDGSPPPAGLTT